MTEGIVVMWLIVFLTNGYPLPTRFIYPAGTVCDDRLAIEAAQEVRRGLGEAHDLQDEIHWTCMDVQPLPPAPPSKLPRPTDPPPLVPKDDA